MAQSYGKSRHIHQRHNTVRQLLLNGIISIDYKRSKNNITDPLTKRFEWRACKLLIEGIGFKVYNLSPIMATLPN